MALKVKTNIDTVNKRISGVLQSWFIKKAENLAEAGEILMQTAITDGNYQDQTGNLRNSIGYVVMYDGKVIRENFGQGLGGQTAQQKAYEHAPNQGIILVVVAGMNYAGYVESKGFNVLTSAQQIAKSLIPQLLK